MMELSGSFLKVVPSMFGAGLAIVAGKAWDIWSSQRTRRLQIRDRYLCQLQLDIDALVSRLKYSAKEERDKHYDPSDKYFAETTAWLVGRVLAREQLMAEHGIFSVMDRKFSGFLQSHLLDRQLSGIGFHRYDRLEFAEAMIGSKKGTGTIHGIGAFRHIRQEREDAGRPLPEAAFRIADSLEQSAKLEGVVAKLDELSRQLSHITGVRRSSELKMLKPRGL